jgi:hypothetical protein
MSEPSYASAHDSPAAGDPAIARAPPRRALSFAAMPTPTMDDESADRIRELEARLVAHGIVLKTIARLLSESTLAELKAAAQGIDDAGMQEANPDLHMRRVAEEIWSILETVG